MLHLRNIVKEYVTGDLRVKALDGISISFRKNEFVSILGPSGGGKTTLLNIIGGLDHCTSGELIIDKKSTKDYKSRDWDAYRNHSIGFVFQSYNLIPHQTVLANVELALTISGVSSSERKKKAMDALAAVGLKNQVKKKPNQLSGGQMQRVAIARALVNDPEILLADEPTGALDTNTSLQIMEILKEVAKDRLVIMVTHNPELAKNYSSRIVNIKDGKIVGDNNPYEKKETTGEAIKQKRTSMKFFTALSLSFNNLWTKRGRTILTAFAGSIGIIGIALILALSSGVNNYITDLQTNTMVSYPITINKTPIQMAGMMKHTKEFEENSIKEKEMKDKPLNVVYEDDSSFEETEENDATENNLKKFKEYVSDSNSDINKYIGKNGVTYSYDTNFQAYTYDQEDALINVSKEDGEQETESEGHKVMDEMTSMGSSSNITNFQELMPGGDGTEVSNVVKDSYKMLYGNWPDKYNEVVVVLDEYNEITTKQLYQMGLLPKSEYDKMIKQKDEKQKVTLADRKWSYEDICKQTLYVIPSCDLYQKTGENSYQYVGDNQLAVEAQLENSIELKITGIIRQKENANYTGVTGPIGYTSSLTKYLIDYTNKSDVVKAQEQNRDLDILSGMMFTPKDEDAKVQDAIKYLSNLPDEEKETAFTMLTAESNEQGNPNTTLDEYLTNPDRATMLMVYDSYVSVSSYEENMKSFGKVDYDSPSSISIYADSFEDKDGITDCISSYNKKMKKIDQINYTDYVELLTSSITSIISIISYVLIAFVAVSLIVSCIMIGIITHISVMERRKEIGILRAIGASKRDVARVFNAETFMIGLCSGILGVGITYLLQIPINQIIHNLLGNNDVNAMLPVTSGLLLILISVVLTLLSGFFPACGAAKKDPVNALRSE